MAGIEVKVDIDDLFESWSGDSLAESVKSTMEEEVLKLVKRDPRYKLLIQQKAVDVVNSMIKENK